MKAAIYARVSTKDQQTIPAQLTAMRAECDRRGWKVVMEIDEKQSGRKNDRPGRRQIIEAASVQKIQAVMVWKLDRWSRSTTDLMTTIDDLLRAGCVFVSLTENLDFSTPAGRALAGMLAVFAQFERDIISERVQAGMTAARDRGVRLGRPARAFAMAALVKQLHAENWTQTRIARELKISRISVQRVLAFDKKYAQLQEMLKNETDAQLQEMLKKVF